MTTEQKDWRDTLAPGDIVAFAFPTGEGDAAQEKDRPGLVIAVDRSGAVGEAIIVYGTAAMTRANTGLELHVTAPADMAAARLRKPTRFVGTRLVRVPLDSPRFVRCAAGTAVLGRLPPALHARLDRIRDLAGPTAPAADPSRRRPRRRLFRTCGRHAA